ncbi:MAG: SH3 domain-containing protein [Spirochaetaceae bacterium]|nr:SH3 domain-containing protein [Spirochaetaceae bacterium]
MKKYYFTIIIILAITALFSCKKEEEIVIINLPPTQVLEQNTNYAVIVSSHLRLRTEPSVKAKAVTTLWKGYILEIVSKSSKMDNVEGVDNYWYQITYGGLKGWVFGAYVMLLSSHEKAKEESEKLKT